MAAVTRATLRTRAQYRAAMEHSQVVATTEWDYYIDSAAAELYDMLVAAYGHEYYATSVSYVVLSDKACAAGTTTPIDTSTYLKILSVHMTFPTGGSVALAPFSHVDRDYRPWVILPRRIGGVRYRQVGNNMEFEPTTRAEGYTGTIRYVPQYVVFSGDSATFNGFDGWEDYIVLKAAIAGRRKLRQEISDLEGELDRLQQRIVIMSANRNMGGAQRIARRARW